MTDPTTANAIETAEACGDTWPDPDVLILRKRELRLDTPADQLSRFADPVWHLNPANPDVHLGIAVVHWRKFPTDLVPLFKTMLLVLLDHPLPANHAVRTGSGSLAIRTVSSHVHYFRALAEWMSEQGLTSFNELTDRRLDDYRTHVRTLGCAMVRKRCLLNTVVLIHSYRDQLPQPCHLGTRMPWGGAQGDYLIAIPTTPRGNKTPRIAPDTMESLLAWSLQMLEQIGPDIAAARKVDQQLRSGEHPSQSELGGLSISERLVIFLASAHRNHSPLPGKHDQDGQLVLDELRLCNLLGLGSTRHQLGSARAHRLVADSGLPLDDGGELVTPITGIIDGRPWRDRPITAAELPDLVRFLTAALFVITCYLSGLRPGEALNLRRGCRAVDSDTGELLLTGRRGKGRGRAPSPAADSTDDNLARRWVVVQPVHDAIALLEQLAPHAWLFPPEFGTGRPNNAATSTRTPHFIARDIRSFVDWVNRTFTLADSGAPIPADPTTKLKASQFRRTLAYFIVRRPRGLIAAALQYGHVATKVTLSYAGDADTAWLDDMAVERLEMVIDQLDRDQTLLAQGEHLSGPSAGEYRMRIEQAAGFAGRVVVSVRNVERLLAQVDSNVYHGQGMTCVWNKESAACRKVALVAGLADLDAPEERQCRSTCVNLAYTDRDIQQLAVRLTALNAHANDPFAPQPLRDRAAAQADVIRRVIDQHDESRDPRKAR